MCLLLIPRVCLGVGCNLSCIRNQAEMAHTCRGTISLHGAVIHTENPASFNFVVSNGGGTQVRRHIVKMPAVTLIVFADVSFTSVK